MSVYKFPIALWTDFDGNSVGETIDGPSASAVGTDDSSVIDQIKKFLVWHYKQKPYDAAPDFRDPVIEQADVPLRSSYKTDQGVFPAETIVNLSFQYIWGKQRDDSVICVIPSIGRHFICSKERSLKSLVQSQVQQHFADATTSTLATSNCPSGYRTEMINVRVPEPRSHDYTFETPTLSEVCIALGERDSRKQFSAAWERETEVKQLKVQLSKRRGNVLLLGEPGVGKTTVLAEAIRQIQKESRAKADEDSSEAELQKNIQRFWMTNASRLIAGMQYLGQWEERCETLVDELSEIRGVLCIENLLQLIQTGASEPTASLAAFFRHFMVNGELRMVAESTRQELETIRQIFPGFDSLFHIIDVNSMTQNQSRRVLRLISDHVTQSKLLEVDKRAVTLCHHLFNRFLPYDCFPGKCALFWKKLLHQSVELKKEKIDVDEVIEAFIEETGMPEFLVRDERLLDSEEVRNHFESKIIGQPRACQAMTDLIMTFKAAMNDPSRPIGVNFFCGPTGVGKTEMAKTLAEYLFSASEKTSDKTENRLVRLDMSEYGSSGSAERLLIDTDGKPSKLVQKIRETPFVVLLFDEIEKASPEVFDVLMTVFDEGRMVDRLGRETNFRSSVIILTSNLGTSNTEPIGFDSSSTTAYEEEVRKFFRPEFFNRLDRVVTFDHLNPESIQKITVKEIQGLREREGLAKRNLRLVCSNAVAEFVAKLGYDRRLGARPLQRTIETKIVTPLAKWLAENPEAENRELKLHLDGDQLRISSD